ncbi:hypothetical protein D3C87_1467060 [compost metagenome]
MEESRERTLAALALMVDQYLERRPDGFLDSYAMTAGEQAITILGEHGYMEVTIKGRIFGRWTKAGEDLLNWTRTRK